MPLHSVPDDGGAPLGPGATVLRDGTAVVDGRRLTVSVEEPCEIVQRYLAGTPVLETVVVTPTSATGVTDLWWAGELVRVVVVHSGGAGIRVDGARGDDGRRITALRHWWERQPAAVEEPARELRALSATLAAAFEQAPGSLRDPAEADDLGLWRLPDGSVDLGAHAAFALAEPEGTLEPEQVLR
jgi:hypothetical protein